MRESKRIKNRGSRFLFCRYCILVLLLTPIFSSFAVSDHPACGDLGRDWSKGFEFPIPFSTNQKVELADKEFYILAGVLRQTTRDFYLEVDLDIHPWLSNSKRQSDPYYLIEITPDSTQWQKLKNRRIKVLVEAIGQIRDENDYLPARYEIILKALARPLLLSEEYK